MQEGKKKKFGEIEDWSVCSVIFSAENLEKKLNYCAKT